MSRLKRISILAFSLAMAAAPVGPTFAAGNAAGGAADGAAPTIPATQALQSHLNTAATALLPYGFLSVTLKLRSDELGEITVSAGHADGAQSLPADPSRAYQIGSQSKTFTAAAILLLAREGKLSLSDPASRYVPGLPGDAGITVAQLVNHTSGMGDGVNYFDTPGPAPDLAVSFENLMFLSHMDGKHFDLGTDFEYNNFAFDVAGKVIEKVTGQPAHIYIREHITNPVGMTHVYFGAGESWPREIMAEGFDFNSKAGERRDMTGPRDLGWAYTAGDMIATADDMLAWIDALTQPGGKAPVTMAELKAGRVSTGDKPSDMTGYGYGVMDRTFGGVRTWGHGGFIHGYLSYSGIVEEENLRFTLLTSLDGSKDFSAPAAMQRFSALLATALHLTLFAEEQADGQATPNAEN